MKRVKRGREGERGVGPCSLGLFFIFLISKQEALTCTPPNPLPQHTHNNAHTHTCITSSSPRSSLSGKPFQTATEKGDDRLLLSSSFRPHTLVASGLIH
jgi:hypothetical protein